MGTCLPTSGRDPADLRFAGGRKFLRFMPIAEINSDFDPLQRRCVDLATLSCELEYIAHLKNPLRPLNDDYFEYFQEVA